MEPSNLTNMSGKKKTYSFLEVFFVALILLAVSSALYRVASGGVKAHKRSLELEELNRRADAALKKVETDFEGIALKDLKFPDDQGDDQGKETLYDSVYFNSPRGLVGYAVKKTRTLKIRGVVYQVGYLERIWEEEGREKTELIAENVLVSKGSSSAAEQLSGFQSDDRVPSRGGQKFAALNFFIEIVGTAPGNKEPEILKRNLRIPVKMPADVADAKKAIEENKDGNAVRFTLKMGEPTSLLAP